MEERIVIITGANSGIGKASAIKFAKEGYRVIMACRNLEKSKPVQAEIIKDTNNDKVDLIEVDLSSFRSIRNFCITYKTNYAKLDILIHNAAYFNHSEKKYQLSADHIEMTFATNLVGPFLMTRLLIDELKKSDDPRILHACSTNIRHFFDPHRKIDFDNLHGEFRFSRPYNVYKQYGDSKMALLMLTFKLAEQLKGDGIIVNALQIPATRMSKETIKKLRSIWRIIAMLQNPFTLETKTMGETYFHLCTSKEFKEISGQLINEQRQIVRPSHYKSDFISDIKQFLDKGVYPIYADSEQTIAKVWELCTRLTNE